MTIFEFLIAKAICSNIELWLLEALSLSMSSQTVFPVAFSNSRLMIRGSEWTFPTSDLIDLKYVFWELQIEYALRGYDLLMCWRLKNFPENWFNSKSFFQRPHASVSVKVNFLKWGPRMTKKPSIQSCMRNFFKNKNGYFMTQW